MLERFDGRLIRETPNAGAAARVAYLAVTIAFLAVRDLRCLPEGLRAKIALSWVAFTVVSTLLMMHLARKRPGWSPVDVRIDEHGIHIDRDVAMRRRDIRSGATHTATSGEIRVVFRERRRLAGILERATPLVFFATDSAEAHAMLAAAGVDARQRVFRTTFLRSHDAWPLLLFFTLAACLARVSWGLFGSPDGFVATMAPILIAGVLASAMRMLVARPTVTVGTDGVEIRRGLRTRFVRFDQIRDAHIDRTLRLVLASGEIVPLAYPHPSQPVGRLDSTDLALECALLRDRIVGGLRAHGLRDPGAPRISVLGRRSRSADDWFASLMVVLAADATASRELRSVLRGIAGATDEAELRRRFFRVCVGLSG